MMDAWPLSSTYQFQGWDIRYELLESQETSASKHQHKKQSVVFVHGTPWSSAVYRLIIKALLAKGSYQILVYDLPGYGQSQKFSPENSAGPIPSNTEHNFLGDTSVKFQGLALAALLKHVQLDGKDDKDAPAVIAHDIAGSIVLRAHLIDGCEFASMMFLDTNAVLPWGDGFYKLARSSPGPFLELPPSIFEAVVRAVVQSAVHNPKVLQAGWEDVLTLPWIDRPSDAANEGTSRQRSFVRQIAQANDADVAEMLDKDMYEQVRCDVKIVWGEQDQWIPRKKMDELATRLKGRVKEFVVVPEAGHLVMLDQPERFAIEVFDWLGRRM